MASAVWNPWHGCTKISPGCAHCYVYRIDAAHGAAVSSQECRRTADFSLPVKRDRAGIYKHPPGTKFWTCFTSDFLLSDADAWRPEAWDMIRARSDCSFFFFTKRIDRFAECLPPDWGGGWENVTVGCTVENQAMADRRLPLFLAAPIRHRTIGVEPMLEAVELSQYLSSGGIEEVSAGGESGPEARVCRYEWVLSLREQCVRAGVPFHYHQTGAKLVKDGRLYRIPRRLQQDQARRAGIDFG